MRRIVLLGLMSSRGPPSGAGPCPALLAALVIGVDGAGQKRSGSRNPGPFADQLEHQLDLAPHLEAGQLDVEGVAGIAVVAAAHCDGYAATGHLLGLLAALPAPTKAGGRLLVRPVEVVGHRVPAARRHQGSGPAFADRRGNRPGPARPLGRR